jgi:hypothetical protein
MTCPDGPESHQDAVSDRLSRALADLAMCHFERLQEATDLDGPALLNRLRALFRSTGPQDHERETTAPD